LGGNPEKGAKRAQALAAALDPDPAGGVVPPFGALASVLEELAFEPSDEDPESEEPEDPASLPDPVELEPPSELDDAGAFEDDEAPRLSVL
jgi:hypothetical protein